MTIIVSPQQVDDFGNGDNVTIRINNLSKCYQIYAKPHQRLLQGFLGSKKQRYREFWALKNISFEIKKGEMVGIIGRNGSGKSTLLQLICGTLTPSSGTVETYGRIAALLELGSGFNPEFTGRENVYMNTSILGLSQEGTYARFDEIAAFADIGNFIPKQMVGRYQILLYALVEKRELIREQIRRIDVQFIVNSNSFGSLSHEQHVPIERMEGLKKSFVPFLKTNSTVK